MYYKITHGSEILLADKLDYIREQGNGVVVRCRAENANGITLDGTNYTESITIASPIGTGNTLFYVKATSSDDESPGNDATVQIKVTAKVMPSA